MFKHIPKQNTKKSSKKLILGVLLSEIMVNWLAKLSKEQGQVTVIVNPEFVVHQGWTAQTIFVKCLVSLQCEKF